MKIHLFKIKKGKLNKWLLWGKTLETKYRKKAIETLKEEGLDYEAFYVFKIKEDYYTIATLIGEAKPANMKRKINIEHKKNKKEALKYIGNVDKEYELTTKD